MECSIGFFHNEACHKKTCSSTMKDINQLPDEHQGLLKLRVQKKDIKTMCTYQEIKYLVKYNHLFGFKYCDPFSITKMLRKITIDFSEKNQQLQLISGKSVCTTYHKKITKLSQSSTVTQYEDEVSQEYIKKKKKRIYSYCEYSL